MAGQSTVEMIHSKHQLFFSGKINWLLGVQNSKKTGFIKVIIARIIKSHYQSGIKKTMRKHADYNLARNKVKLPGHIPETERDINSS